VAVDAADPRQRFSGAAAAYARYRPDYPDALLDWLVAQAALAPGDPVADVGCGTGIFTRRLAQHGLVVTGVDPNEDMLAEARAEGGGAEYRRGEAAATGLPAASVALVSVAQAFHWFDKDEALAEFARILRPQGRVAAIYNLRGEGTFMDAYDALLRRFSSQYGVLESWEAALDALRRHPVVTDRREWDGAHVQRFDFEALHGRAWTSSYVFRGVGDAGAFDAALRALFDTHQTGGQVEFRYRCVALLFRVALPVR
jgi:ubiquinone/menaquinone biosynthesis C-methylase UbiE